MNESLSCFKRENVLAVYDLITKPGKRSRTEIAGETGISLPTVIKIVDVFAKAGMVRLSSVTVNGRSAKYVSLNPEKYCIVFDLSTEKFKTYFISLRGELLCEFTPPSLVYGPDFMIDEKLDELIKSTSEFLKMSYKKSHCFGYGFLMPGEFDDGTMKVKAPRYPQINRLNFEKILSEKKFPKTNVFSDIRECYTLNALRLTDSGESSLFIYFDLNDISTGYHINSISAPNLTYAPFGKAVIRDGHTLESICREMADPYDVAPIFAEEIFELSKKIPVDNVFIIGNRYSPMPLFSKLVSEELEKYRNPDRTYLPRVRYDISKMPHIAEISAKVRDANYLGYIG